MAPNRYADFPEKPIELPSYDASGVEPGEQIEMNSPSSQRPVFLGFTKRTLKITGIVVFILFTFVLAMFPILTYIAVSHYQF